MGTRRLLSRIPTFMAIIALILTNTSVARAEDFESPPPPGNFHWKVYDYNASGQALRSRQPFIVNTDGDGGIAFDFLYSPDTALLITGHPSYRGDLLGDISSKTMISATVGVTVMPLTTDFDYYGEPDVCDTAGTNGANVRFFFQTQTTGPFNPMDYWWANSSTSHVQLNDLKAGDITITNSFLPSQWSDWDGHFADDPLRPEHLAAFNAALHNVKAIGLSFGGGCFFENGVGIEAGTGSGFFRLQDFTVTPPPPPTLLINTDVVPTLLLAPFVTPTLIELP
jgi:hypothetical protein